MPTIRLKTVFEAPIERVFDLSRSVDMHVDSTAETGERAIAGRTSGLMEYGEAVTWEAKHFGLTLRLTSQIVQFDRPFHFRDSMITGPFRSFFHDHHFETSGATTILRDTFDYRSPLGPLGRLADGLFLESYMRSFLTRRNEVLVRVAESNTFQRYLGSDYSTSQK